MEKCPHDNINVQTRTCLVGYLDALGKISRVEVE